jgi:hypothetical protein
VSSPPALAAPKSLRIVLADASTERICNFHLRGEGYHLRIARTSEKLEETLKLESWDLVLHSCHLGDWGAKAEDLAKPLVEAFKAKRLRGVICTSTIDTDARKFIAALRAEGIPSIYVPYSYQTPGNHVKVGFSNIPYPKG